MSLFPFRWAWEIGGTLEWRVLPRLAEVTTSTSVPISSSLASDVSFNVALPRHPLPEPC